MLDDLFLYVVLLVVLVTTGSRFLAFKRSDAFQSVTGTILTWDVEKLYGGTRGSSSHGSVSYKIDITYRYAANGREYTGSSIINGIPNVVSSMLFVNVLKDKFKQGAEAPVYYNPLSPSEACLLTSKDVPAAGLFVIAGVSVLAFFIIWKVFQFIKAS